MNRTIAIYPGSFDPPTNGHLDLIERGSKIFDELVVAILRNPEKAPLFSVAERTSMLERLTEPFRNVRVDTFDGLMVDYALRVNATCILRGIRAQVDGGKVLRALHRAPVSAGASLRAPHSDHDPS